MTSRTSLSYPCNFHAFTSDSSLISTRIRSTTLQLLLSGIWGSRETRYICCVDDRMIRMAHSGCRSKVNGYGEERSGLGKQLVARRLWANWLFSMGPGLVWNVRGWHRVVVNTERSKKHVGRKVLADLWVLGGKTNSKGIAIGVHKSRNITPQVSTPACEYRWKMESVKARKWWRQWIGFNPLIEISHQVVWKS